MPNHITNSLFLVLTSFLLVLNIVEAQTITGKYTGDGNSTQSISGIGFQPDLLLVIPSSGGSTGGEVQTWLNSSTMASDKVKYTTSLNNVASSFKSGYLASIDSDGFTVETKSNVNGTEYYYVAFSENDGSVTTGSFTGSAGSQNIVTGYEPGMVWVWSDNLMTNDYVKWTQSDKPSTTYLFSSGTANWGHHTFNGFSPIGFTVKGSSPSGSGIVSGETYNYVSFQNSIATANVGHGSGPDKVTTSIEPGFLMTGNGGSNYIRTHDMPSGESFIPDHTSAQTNGILDFYADGYDVGNTGNLRGKHYYFVTEYINVLPVEFIKFQGREIESETHLSWITGSEVNNDYFEIQASNDGLKWESLRVVNGAGNSFSKLHYTENLGEDKNRYYRLKQVDFSGSFQYSNVIYITRDNSVEDQFILFPNPADNQLNLQFNSSNEAVYKAEVFAINGSLVGYSSSLNGSEKNMTSIDVSDLAEGVYSVIITDDSGFKSAKRFIKK